MIIFYKNEKVGTFIGVPDLDLCAAMAIKSQGDVIDYAQISMKPETAEEKIALIRSGIDKNAGDTASMIGTTTDATQLLLFGFATLIKNLNTASSIAEVRQAAAPFDDLATGFLSKVESGEVKLPFQQKGISTVVSDIENRATAVADVLSEMQEKNLDTQ